jgi:hypothetical protein
MSDQQPPPRLDNEENKNKKEIASDVGGRFVVSSAWKIFLGVEMPTSHRRRRGVAEAAMRERWGWQQAAAVLILAGLTSLLSGSFTWLLMGRCNWQAVPIMLAGKTLLACQSHSTWTLLHRRTLSIQMCSLFVSIQPSLFGSEQPSLHLSCNGHRF